MAFSSLLLSLMDNWIPRCLLAILMCINPEFLHRILRHWFGLHFQPIAYSFGWVAYAFKNIAMTLSGNSILQSDYSTVVVNRSPRCILVRIVDVFYGKRSNTFGKYIVFTFTKPSVYLEDGPFAEGVFKRSVLLAVIQSSLSALLWIYHGDLSTCLISVLGILLAFITNEVLPRCRAQKYENPCKRNTVYQTRGYNTQYTIGFFGEKSLSNCELPNLLSPAITDCFAFLLAVFWTTHVYILLIINERPLHLLLIGCFGTVYNIIASRPPQLVEMLRPALKFVDLFECSPADALKQLESSCPGASAALRDTIFPGIEL